MRPHRFVLALPALVAALANAQSLGSALAIGTTGTLDEATDEIFEAIPPGASDTTVWYWWTAPADAPVQITACSPDGSVYDTVRAYTGSSVASLFAITTSGYPLCGAGTTFYAFAGTTYRIQVTGTP